MQEVWQPIPGFETYQVSNLGKVMNKLGKILKGFKIGQPTSKHWAVHLMSPYNLQDGWEKRQKTVYIHRAVLMAFVGHPPENHEGCHRDDNCDNNILENLYWGTRKQNSADQIRNGRFFFPYVGRGENCVNSIFSDQTIRKILAEYTGKRGEQTILAKKYGMSQQWISDIVRGKARTEVRSN